MVSVERSRCIGCGVCVSLCPDGFEMVNGKSKVKNQNSNCLAAAVRACPQGAIILGDGQDGEEGKKKDKDNYRVGESRSFSEKLGLGRGLGRRGQGLGCGKGRGRRNRKGRGSGRRGAGRRGRFW
ncbi:MAG TPA: ferredoxin [Candidatus Parcubacteria bacterium]|nr:ferredoxin [Candidatus Parcubacteria bacterium]